MEGEIETYKDELKKPLNEKIIVAQDLTWTWREREITCTFVGEDYMLIEEEYYGQEYYTPINQTAELLELQELSVCRHSLCLFLRNLIIAP